MRFTANQLFDHITLRFDELPSGEVRVVGKDANGEEDYILSFQNNGGLYLFTGVKLTGIEKDDGGRISVSHSND